MNTWLVWGNQCIIQTIGQEIRSVLETNKNKNRKGVRI
jgi:hypothetical protein